MAVNQSVAQNYAKALLGVVEKENIPLDAAIKEGSSLRDFMSGQDNVRVFLEGPQFRETDKHQFVSNVFREQLSNVFFEFVHLLLKHDRIDHLSAILDEFEELVEEKQGLTMGVVTTAVSLSEEEQENMKQKLEAFCEKKFDLRFKVDPALIGGVKVKYGDTLIDTSISSYLNDIRYRLHNLRIVS